MAAVNSRQSRFRFLDGFLSNGQDLRRLLFSLSVVASILLTSPASLFADSVGGSVPDAHRPIVLTIDGIKPSELLPGDWLGSGRTVSYLEPAIRDWKLVNHVEYLMWDGSTAGTERFIDTAKGLVEVLSRRARDEDRPFVVVGHSWGSVIAARAIAEVGAARRAGGYEGNTDPLLVDQFVTLGSPLNSQQDFLIENETQSGLAGTTAALASRYIDHWRNYWLESDNISGSIPEASADVKLPELSIVGRLPGASHGDYFEEPIHWQRIGLEITVKLLSSRLLGGDRGELTLIVDSSTPLPNGERLACYPGAGLHFDGQNVPFIADGGTSLYLSDGEDIRTVFDKTTKLPGPSFETVSRMSELVPRIYDYDIDSGRVYFSTVHGLYVEDAGSVRKIVDSTDFLPSSTDHYSGIYFIAAANNTVAFISGTSNETKIGEGAYAVRNGEIRAIATTSVIDPSTGQNFTAAKIGKIYGSGLSTAAGWVTFKILGSDASSLLPAIYADDGKRLHVVFDSNTVLPGGVGGFPALVHAGPGGEIAFAVENRNSFPAYIWRDGTIVSYASDPVNLSTDGSEIYNSMGYSDFGAGKLVIMGRNRQSGLHGIFSIEGTTATPVVTSRDKDFVSVPRKLWIGEIADNRLLFMAEFGTGSCALYVKQLR